MSVDLGPLGRALYSADHLVSLRGPATRSDPYRNLAAVAAPVLVVHAAADRLVDPDVARRLRGAATAAARADLLEVPGADHGFSRHQTVLGRRRRALARRGPRALTLAGVGQRAQRSRASGGRTSVPVKLTISTSSTEEFSARPWHPIAARVGFPRSP